MRARRASTTVVALLLVAVVPAGCGEDDPVAAYCDEVTERQQPLTEIMAEPGPTALIEALPHFEALAAEAPDDVRDEWSTVIGRIQGLSDALEDAGVEPGKYDRRNPPPGVTEEQRKAIDGASKGLTEPETVEAFEDVQQQVRDVCHTPLTLA